MALSPNDIIPILKARSGQDGLNNDDFTALVLEIAQQVQPQYQTAVLPIGAWNMDANPQTSVPLPTGLTVDAIRSLSATIIPDAGFSALINLNSQDGNNVATSSTQGIFVGGTDVFLNRATGGAFDSANYNGAANRGWITIVYDSLIAVAFEG